MLGKIHRSTQITHNAAVGRKLTYTSFKSKSNMHMRYTVIFKMTPRQTVHTFRVIPLKRKDKITNAQQKTKYIANIPFPVKNEGNTPLHERDKIHNDSIPVHQEKTTWFLRHFFQVRCAWKVSVNILMIAVSQKAITTLSLRNPGIRLSSRLEWCQCHVTKNRNCLFGDKQSLGSCGTAWATKARKRTRCTFKEKPDSIVLSTFLFFFHFSPHPFTSFLKL